MKRFQNAVNVLRANRFVGVLAEEVESSGKAANDDNIWVQSCGTASATAFSTSNGVRLLMRLSALSEMSTSPGPGIPVVIREDQAGTQLRRPTASLRQ